MNQPAESTESVKISLGLPERYRIDAARLFYEVFRSQLRPLMPSEEIALGLLPSDFDSERVIVAIVDDKLAGFAGLAFGKRSFMMFKRRDFVARFGVVGGEFRYFLYKTCARPRLDGDLIVDGLGVTEGMRNRGIGAKLISAVCDFAKENGFRAVRLEVADNNETARRLYERAGFVTIRTRTLPAFIAVHADYRVDIEMRKRLM